MKSKERDEMMKNFNSFKQFVMDLKDLTRSTVKTVGKEGEKKGNAVPRAFTALNEELVCFVKSHYFVYDLKSSGIEGAAGVAGWWGPRTLEDDEDRSLFKRQMENNTSQKMSPSVPTESNPSTVEECCNALTNAVRKNQQQQERLRSSASSLLAKSLPLDLASQQSAEIVLRVEQSNCGTFLITCDVKKRDDTLTFTFKIYKMRPGKKEVTPHKEYQVETPVSQGKGSSVLSISPSSQFAVCSLVGTNALVIFPLGDEEGECKTLRNLEADSYASSLSFSADGLCFCVLSSTGMMRVFDLEGSVLLSPNFYKRPRVKSAIFLVRDHGQERLVVVREDVCSLVGATLSFLSEEYILVGRKLYEILGEIGKGASATVLHVLSDEGQQCALKIVDLRDKSPQEKDELASEIATLSCLEGVKGAINMIDSEITFEVLKIVMEHGKDLYSEMTDEDSKSIPLLLQIFLEIVRAV